MSERTIILHYHLFKNAGTSFDGILRRNFPGRWVSQEFDRRANSALVAEWIKAEPDAVAFSSHTANGPLPDLPGVRVFSCIFLRDPVARIRSAYQFERRQVLAAGDAATPAQLARHASLDSYVRTRLAVPGDRQCRDFHCARLATFEPGAGTELDRAKVALRQFAFVGRVEDFAGSIRRFAALIEPVWPQLVAPAIHLNRSDTDESDVPDGALAALLESSNQQDRALLLHAAATVWAG